MKAQIHNNAPLDYYPFGMLMPGRSYSSTAYKYGFNRKEKDDELKGDGNNLDFGARNYDSRLGRWLSLDPLQAKYPSLSAYIYCNNRPVLYSDFDGKDFYVYMKDMMGNCVPAIFVKTELSTKDICIDQMHPLLLPLIGTAMVGPIKLDLDAAMKSFQVAAKQFGDVMMSPDAIVIDVGASLTVYTGGSYSLQIVQFLNGNNKGEAAIYKEYTTPFRNIGLDVDCGIEIGAAWYNHDLEEEPTAENFAEGDNFFATCGYGTNDISASVSNVKGDCYPYPNVNGHTWKWISVTGGIAFGPQFPGKIEFGGAAGCSSGDLIFSPEQLQCTPEDDCGR